jgi:UDPglucose--hexose-1-phosphate uridylyltransferase
MPELRKDPIIRRWVVIAKERAKRPSDFKQKAAPPDDAFCPFCEGNEDKTPPEILAYRKAGTEPNKPGWWVRVIPNKFPALDSEGDIRKSGVGMYDLMNGIGVHEVFVETPRHMRSSSGLEVKEQKEVIWAYRDRLLNLKKDKRFVYGLIFKNVGREAGASLTHTHSQLIATPFVPIRISEEIRGSADYYSYRGRCIFCDMIREELGFKERIVAETDEFVAFGPWAARFPFETWIVPKQHLSHFENSPKQVVEDFALILKTVITKLEIALEDAPYNYLIHSAPFDRDFLGEYHWHLELIPRLTKVAGFEWGSGCYINPVSPEDASAYLREVEC